MTAGYPTILCGVRPPDVLRTLVDRFDPEVFDARDGDARLRLSLTGESSWDAVFAAGGLRLEPASGQPDAELRAGATTWSALARDMAIGLEAYGRGDLVLRHNLHLAVAFLAATSGSIDPARMRFRTVRPSGRRFSLLEAGAGEPLVMLHGLGGTKASFLPTVAALSDRYRTIAVDLPGFGNSPMPEEISISFYAHILDDLLDALGIESAVVVGNSMGGFIGAELAINHPARVERLVLGSAAGISTTTRARRPTTTMFRVSAVISSAALARSRDLVARPRLRHAILSSVMRHPSRLRHDILLEIMPGANAPGFVPALDALLDYDFTDRLGRIGCPTLLIWGREDMIVPVADADEYERLIESSRKVIFDETGHVPMLERPQSFNDYLMEFVVETGPGAAGEPALRAPEVASA